MLLVRYKLIKSKMVEIQRSNSGLSGEYFVAAELLRRGFRVVISMENSKAIYILAEKKYAFHNSV